jgi:glycosyltransferase involved in cell wall biosynthesis
MAAFTDITTDGRVQREARSLAAAGFGVSLVCTAARIAGSDLHPLVDLLVRQSGDDDAAAAVGRGRAGRAASIPGVGAVTWPIGFARSLRRWGRRAIAAAGDVDAWHAHDFPALVAISSARRDDVPIIYDSHEIFFESGSGLRLPAPLRWLARRYEGRLVRRAAALVTVNPAIAEVMEARYQPRRIVVVHNCPERWVPPPHPDDHLRAATGIEPTTPIILYLGKIGPHRGIEQLLEVLLEPGLQDAHLVVLGSSNLGDWHSDLIADDRWRKRVHLLEAVPPGDVPRWAFGADVGTALIQPTTLNHRLSSPNKMFECLAAGVPVVASDFDTMREIIMADPGNPLGVVCDPTDVAAIGRAIRSLIEADIEASTDLRARCFAAAQSEWNWGVQAEALVRLYEDLLPSGADQATAS